MANERILVVDDEPSIRKLCQLILEQEGYQVDLASSGEEAVNKARNRSFELIITDIRMPGMDGIETVRLIREFHPNILCVVITGYGELELALKAIKVGVQGFLLKPFGPDELTSTVSRVLEIERLRQDSLRLKALLPLFEVSRLLMSTLDVNRLTGEILRVAREGVAADSSWMYLVDQDVFLCEPEQGFAIFTPDLQSVVMREVEGAEKAILLSRQNLNEGLVELLEEAEVSCLLVAPLRVGKRLLGFLAVLKSLGAGGFMPSDMDFITILAGQAAVAMENARLFEEVQRAFRELQELDRLKSNFITLVAHELRTPLSLILGYASLLTEEIKDPSLKEYTESILRSSQRLSSLVNQMLDLRMLEQRAAAVRLETIVLPELVSKVIDNYHPIIKNKAQEITVEIPPELLKVRADPVKLEMVLSNLISNAVKFTPSGGHIWVGACDGENPRIYVRDNGIGIPPEEHERIFQSFYQVEEPLTRSRGGLGLGLSIAKEMVELWGGRIWVESEVGKGSTFWFTLPRQEAGGEKPARGS